MIAPLALSPSVPPGPGPVNLLNAVRAPFHVHPPYSVAMFVVRLHPNPVGEPAPRARPTSVCPPPPPPFPVQPYLSRYPPYERESIFVIAPLAPPPSI